MVDWLGKIRYILLIGPTLEVRFFFALSSIGWGLNFTFNKHPSEAALVLHHLAPNFVPSGLFWGGFFLLYATMLLRGLLGRYGIIPLVFEAVLGWALWTLVAFTYWVVEGVPGPSVGGALVAAWLLVRYPTHWEDRRG